MTRSTVVASSTLACFVVLTGCADCGDPRPRAEPQPREPGAAPGTAQGSDDEAVAELRRLAAEPPRGPATAPAELAKLLPERVGSFVSRSPAKEQVFNLGNGGRMTSAKRNYLDVGDSLAVEIIDASHTVLPRAIITQMQGKDRSTERDVFRGAVMHELPGILQWSQKTGLARAGVLIADRFLVNAEVGPSEDERAAERIMLQLDLSGIIALARQSSPPEQSSQAVQAIEAKQHGPAAQAEQAAQPTSAPAKQPTDPAMPTAPAPQRTASATSASSPKRPGPEKK